jgi:hypothetical protein
MRLRIMKAVAERDDPAWLVARDDGSQSRQRRRRVVRRQQDAAGGEAGAFFQMQVGDDQQPFVVPEQHARCVGGKLHACDIEHGNGEPIVVAAGDPCVHRESILPCLRRACRMRRRNRKVSAMRAADYAR